MIQRFCWEGNMFDDLTANPIQRTDSFESNTKAKKHMGRLISRQRPSQGEPRGDTWNALGVRAGPPTGIGYLLFLGQLRQGEGVKTAFLS